MSPTLSAIVTALNGVLVGLVMASPLIWGLRRSTRSWRHLATHDEVTGLPNRRAVLTALHRTLRTGCPAGFIMIDLDHFKTINDQWGHESGNDLLAMVGQRLADLPPPVRMAARLSGDEFALLVDTDQVAVCARQAWRAICVHPIALDTVDVPVAASVGYTTIRPGISPRQVLREADEAMYHAKTTGCGVVGAPTPTTGTPGRCRDRRHRP